jgi:hypothetical protein
MKSAPTNIIRHVVACLGVIAVTPCLGTTQIALPGDMDPQGRVYTQITARVGDLGSNSPTIPGLTVYVVSEEGRRVTLRTTLGGTASAWLARARYRIVTPEPFQYEGRLYTWDTIAVVRPGNALVRLQLSNAKSREVPLATWKLGDAASTETFKDGRVIRTLSRDGVAISASMIRNDDLMWAEISISNGSKHKVDVEPRTFTLTELSPKQMPLRYLIAAELPKGGITHRVRVDVNRMLTANTLLSGQHVAGIAYFERDKEAREVMLRVPLSGVTFDVPLTIR